MMGEWMCSNLAKSGKLNKKNSSKAWYSGKPRSSIIFTEDHITLSKLQQIKIW